MRITLTFLFAMAMAVATVSLVGCGSSKPDADHADADHADADDAHADKADDDHDAHAGHDHGTEGPRGGHLIELGANEYQAELMHDEKSGKVTIHLLDRAAKKPVAMAGPTITLQLFSEGKFIGYDLKAVPSEAGAEKASQFEIVDAALSEALDSKEPVRGRLQLNIEGKQYSAEIKHESHDDHEH